MKTPRQLELIEAAIKLTAADGIQKLTIRNVASAIGVSEAAVYRHFESKHELLKAILAYLDAMLSPRFEALLESKAPAFEALLSFLSDLFTLLEHNTAFTLMLFAEETFNVDPQLQTELLSLMEGNLARRSGVPGAPRPPPACRHHLRLNSSLGLPLAPARSKHQPHTASHAYSHHAYHPVLRKVMHRMERDVKLCSL
jgi:AcrR family transcriptional regulator